MNAKKTSQQRIQAIVDNFNASEKEKITQFLEADNLYQPMPMISRILSGFGAWLSSLLLLPFLYLSEIIEGKTGLVTMGIIFILSAIFISQTLANQKDKDSPYLNQLALMLALAGNALFIIGVGMFNEGSDSSFMQAMLISHLFVGTILYLFLNNIVYRFLVPVFTVVLIFIFQVEQKSHQPVNITFIIESVLFIGLFYKEFLDKKLLPLFYSCALLLPATIILSDMSRKFLWFRIPQVPTLYMTITISIVLIMMAIKIFRAQKLTHYTAIALSILSIIILSYFSTPAILIAFTLLICGHYLCDNYILTLGYMTLPLSLFYYYYSLQMTLIHKSYLLLSTAFALFLLYAAILMWQKKVQ